MIAEKQQNLVETSAITLPADQYAHTGAPSEWWWHVGTLHCEDGRTFGFEINATGKLASQEVPTSYAFTQIEIMDVKNQRNYQQVTTIVPLPPDWAQYDATQPWFVALGQSNPSGGTISMAAIDGNPLNMSVQAKFTDVDPKTGAKTNCELDLHLFQQGPPLLVWGTGCKLVNKNGTSPLTRNNYYYSLTHLQASGTIKIGTEEINVTGLTWMDHEYGYFPDGSTGKVIWMLQDIQLGNGLHLSNYTEFGVLPQENVPMPSNATLLVNGESIPVKTITTPLAPVFISAKGTTYFLKFKIEIEGYEQLSFMVTSAYSDQVFRDEDGGADIYEGIGTAQMIFHLNQQQQIILSEGTAWIEEDLGK